MHIATETISVRYAETDQMGVVYHANYLIWCEIGRTKLMEDLGYKYAELETSGILSPVVNVNMNYKYPARYGEDITIHTWIAEYNGIRVTYGYEIVNQRGKVCLEGTSEHVCVKKDTFRPIAVKKFFPELHAAYGENKKHREEQ
ncbi:acyl-CoA thioester hydrolase [Evansella caseinilytica]|uniref:Acyl-CoA thioester hydrolase n=1 Tax=Evansella caseinilytica TaxID=1503961 RepID=A0A1H3V230_9BACI|nr:thioesterase family protein [Evansella caseinilytica]SDZ68129.1 acyl-CoA thioester hydrolase [Evansella caseinilytica]